MAFPTDDRYLGPAAFGLRKGTEGIIWHTTESADASRASAVATAEWQKTHPGSYNFIIYDGGILLTVPYLEASGGVNPASAYWAPSRFPFLKVGLSAAAYADPNAYLFHVAFSGRTAVFRDQGMPANMVETARQLTAWAERAFNRAMFHCGHMHWQTNRSDPSQKVLDLIAAPEDDMPALTEYTGDWVTIDAGANIRDEKGNVLFMTGDKPSTALRIGTVGPNSVYWIGALKRWGYTDTAANIIKAVPLSEAFRVEVPTGITQTQLDEARKAGFVDAKTKAAKAVEEIRL